MRSTIAGLALTLLMAIVAVQPAAAGHKDRHYRGGYVGADVYVHHHVYYPPRRIKHVYHVYRPGPYHVHVVTYGGAPYVWYNAKGSYFGQREYYRWRGYRGHRGW